MLLEYHMVYIIKVLHGFDGCESNNVSFNTAFKYHICDVVNSNK
jgi:hypothetical protein